MKQPELGKKITELRKAKGLTQEDLVERCNISVRTIQRIESGEVAPRSFTVKSILAALDSDLNELEELEVSLFDSISSSIRNFLLIDIDINKPSSFLFQQLTLAWVFGILYFAIGFFEGAAEYYLYEKQEMIFGNTGYVILKVVVLISFIFFTRGIVMIGGLFRNYLLRIMSVILIGATTIMIALDIFSVYYKFIEKDVLVMGAGLSFGAIGLFYGVAIRKLKPQLGQVANLAGIFQIIAACFFLLVVLSVVGFIFLIPAELFEIILIFKAIALFKEKEA